MRARARARAWWGVVALTAAVGGVSRARAAIIIDFDEHVRTNATHVPGKMDPRGCVEGRKYGRKGVRLAKADAVGHFELGSTVVLVFEARARQRWRMCVMCVGVYVCVCVCVCCCCC